MPYDVRIVSALEKVFADAAPLEGMPALSVFLRDAASFQVACTMDGRTPKWVTVQVESPLLPWMTVREVKLSPSTYPCHPMQDEGYLRCTPGLFPDRLALLEAGERFKVIPGQWRALWLDVEPDEAAPVGPSPVTVIGIEEDGAEAFRQTLTVEVIGQVLPKHTLYHTEWFHADCLADYYGVDPDSDALFDMVEPFLRIAVKRGMNTILTPMFTPPLDTAEGGERTTVQLVGVRREGGAYTFDFSRLARWVALCDACGMETIELSHLFSQWGAKYAPKIMGYDHGQYRQLFGWDTPGIGEAYVGFLDSFLPALRAALEDMGIAHRCLLHISDEPEERDLERYRRAKEIVRARIADIPIVDAMSHFELYQTSGVEVPIVANNAIQPFLDAGVTPLWTYYCTAQWRDVSNRFFSMPSARTRVLGVQLYKYDIQGFLHWGYNFYNTQYSLRQINPYVVTDAGDAFPSGDAFLVYPGPDGQPEESIRIMLMQQAFDDIRALRLLESLTDRGYVLRLIEEGLEEPITFDRYPKDAGYLLQLRARVNQEIARNLHE